MCVSACVSVSLVPKASTTFFALVVNISFGLSLFHDDILIQSSLTLGNSLATISTKTKIYIQRTNTLAEERVMRSVTRSL